MSSESDVKLKLVVKTLESVLESNCSRLEMVLRGSLSRFSSDMLEKKLISRSVKESGDVDCIITEFKSGWGFVCSLSVLQSQWHNFLNILDDLGGPQSAAANKLESELNDELKKEAPELLFPTRYNRSSSTPENVVSIKPKINRKAYSEDRGQGSMQHQFHAFEQTDIEDGTTTSPDVSTTATDMGQPIYFQARQEDHVYGLGYNSSEFTSPARPITLNNVVTPGQSTSTVDPQAISAPVTNDSGISMRRTSSGGSFVASKQLTQSQHELKLPTPTTKPHQAMSDQSHDYMMHVLHYKEFVSSEERKERQDTNNKLLQYLQSDNEDLKKQIQEIRNEKSFERNKLLEERKEMEQTLSTERNKLLEERKEMEQTLSTERKKLSEERKEMEQTQQTLVTEMKQLSEEKKQSLAAEKLRLSKQKKEIEQTQQKLLKQEQEFLQKAENDKRQFDVRMEYIKKERNELYKQRKHQEESYRQKHQELENEVNRRSGSEIIRQQQEMVMLRNKNEETLRRIEKDKNELQRAQNDLKKKERELEIKQQEVVQQEKDIFERSKELDEKTFAREEELKNKESVMLEQDRLLKLRELKVAESQRLNESTAELHQARYQERKKQQKRQQRVHLYWLKWLKYYHWFLRVIGFFLLLYTLFIFIILQ